MIDEKGNLAAFPPQDAPKEPQGLWELLKELVSPIDAHFRNIEIALDYGDNFNQIAVIAAFERSEFTDKDLKEWKCSLVEKESRVPWGELCVEGMHFNRFWLTRKRQNQSHSPRRITTRIPRRR